MKPLLIKHILTRSFFGSALLLFTINSNAQSTGSNNILSATEKADGYQLLWNGKDFTGWKSYNTPGVSGTWSIVHNSGVEVTPRKSVDPDSNILEVNASGASMFTIDTSYQDFDYKVEWKTPVGVKANSGLIIHYRESMGEYNGASGPESQIVNSLWTQEWTSELTTAGCDYEMIPLLKARINPDHSPNWVKPDGQWNEFRIVSFGKRTAHYGNGVRLLEYQMFSPSWNTAYKASKYSQYPNYNNLHPGSIYLQNHGEPYTKFRNLRIKKLTQNPWASDSPYLNKTAAATGDSSLIDNLAFATNLFPVTVKNISPNSIVPKTANVKTVAGGMQILFPIQGNYSVQIQNLQGVTLSNQNFTKVDKVFISGNFRKPSIIKILASDQKIEQTLVTGN